MRKTKIICTLGPKTDNIETLRAMVHAGMNVARLNFSHGSHEEHLGRINMVKKVREEMKKPIAILLDTKGPEIRIGTFTNGSITLEAGQTFTLCTEKIVGDNTRVSVSYNNLPNILHPGDRILMDDGLIELRVTECTETTVTGTIKNSGKLSNHKSINLPGIEIDMPYMTDRDCQDILFGIQQDVDFIAASFVRTRSDVLDVRRLLDENGGKDIRIIAKIENAQGVHNADEILEEANGIMIARGDMGVEIPFETLPAIQKSLIKKCYIAGKSVITATQMLDSMMQNPRPTRAEVTDVANAVYDGTGAIMLSGETAAGLYPVESVTTMAKIAETTERSINYAGRLLRENVQKLTATDAICHAACTTALDLNAKAIVAVTWSGHTARMLSKFRPACPIVAAAANRKTYYQLALFWGVTPMMNELTDSAEELVNSAAEKAIQSGKVEKGDIMVLTCGSSVGSKSSTDTMRVFEIK